MVSRAETLNRKTRKQVLQTTAELVHRKLKQKIIQLDIPSHIPTKEINFADSIRITWIDYFTPIVGSELLYAINIEEGRQAGYHVPIKPLIDWCVYKLKLELKEATAVAYAIERKIFEQGIRGKHLFRIVLQEIQDGNLE